MGISTQVVTIGTAVATIGQATADAQRLWIENLEPDNEIGAYSRDGYAYIVNQLVTIPNNGATRFSFTTGPTGA